MAEHRYRVLAIATHPVQYMSPIFRRMATQGDLDLHVAYCSLRGAESARDPEFDTAVQWDIPLLDGYSWSHVANRGTGAEAFFGLFNPGLWKTIRKCNYHAILCFTGYVCATFWIALLAAKLSSTPFLFGTDATSLTPRQAGSWKITLKKVLWPRLFRLADQVIVPSSDGRDLMLSLGIPSERITLTPYSVDNNWWILQSGQVDRCAVRAEWGASAGDIVILFCAKLQAWKRPFDLLHAFSRASLSRALLVFAGEGPLHATLEEEASALGVADRVRFLGFVNQSQLPAVYAAADLLVLPSEYEPFGVVVNEAMCCGCAVAASDRCGAARDLVAPVDPQLVFPCRDIDALSKVLKYAATDRDRLQAIARASVARIRTWSPERNIASTVDAIRVAAERKRCGSPQVIPDSPASHPASTGTAKLRE